MITPPNEGCLEIAGARGTGKTSLIWALLIQRNQRRRIISDPLQDYQAGEIGCPVEFSTGSIKEFKNYMDDVKPDEAFSVAFVPGDDLTEEDAALFLAEYSWYTKNCTFVLEEAYCVASQHKANEEIIKLMKRGRHRGVSVWCVSQRPSDINTSIRAELRAQESWVLRLAEENDLAMLARRRGPEFAERVSYLPKLHAYRIDPVERHPKLYRIYFVDNVPRVVREDRGNIIFADED